MFRLCKFGKCLRKNIKNVKLFRRSMGGVGFPDSYFGIAHSDVKKSRLPEKAIKPSLIFLVVGGDASGKTTMIDKLINKFTQEHNITPVCKAPINPLDLHEELTSNKVVFIDIHEFNNEMYNWIHNINAQFKNDYGFVLIHPHVSMETYRKRVTDRLLNNSLELRFGIKAELFERDILRHTQCAQSLITLKNNTRDMMDACIIYENNTPNKEIINIFTKNYDYVYNQKLLDEVFDKKHLDKIKEVSLTKAFYDENSPYNHANDNAPQHKYGELDYDKLILLKNKNLNKYNNTPFFPKKLNDVVNAICIDYSTTCDRKLDRKNWFKTFDKFAKDLQTL